MQIGMKMLKDYVTEKGEMGSDRLTTRRCWKPRKKCFSCANRWKVSARTKAARSVPRPREYASSPVSGKQDLGICSPLRPRFVAIKSPCDGRCLRVH